MSDSALGKRNKDDLNDKQSLWRVYIRVPRPDYKRPSISEFEFFHHDEKLAKAVFETKIIEELDGFFEGYFEEQQEEIYKAPMDFLHLFTDDKQKRNEYLFGESYMDVEPQFIFEKYSPNPTTEFTSRIDSYYEHLGISDDENVVQRTAIISEYFPKKMKPSPKSANK